MKMRNLFLTTLFAVIATIGFSQNVQPSTKVLQGMDKATLRTLNEEQLLYWNYYSQNSYIVHDEAKSAEGLPLLSSVLKEGNQPVNGSSLTQDSFNPFNYNINPLPSEAQFFLVDGTNKVVQLHSQSTIDMQYGRFLTNQQKLNGTKK